MIKDIGRKHPVLLSILWHVFAIGFVLLFARHLNRGSLPVSDENVWSVFLFIGCYLVAIAVVFIAKKVRIESMIMGPAVYAGLSSIVLLAIIIFSFQYSRINLAVVFGLLGLFSLFYSVFAAFRGILLLVLFVISIIMAFAFQGGVDVPAPSLSVSDYVQSKHRSALYDLDIRKYQNVVPRQTTHSAMAAIEHYKDSYVLVMANGDIYTVKNIGSDKEVETNKWNVRVPVNYEEFLADASSSSYLHYFRALDVLIINTGGSDQMLVSHHYWNRDKQCAVVRISSLDMSSIDGLDADGAVWRKLYETTPCLPLQPVAWAFRGMEGGGRLARYGEEGILLTVGDHGMNGVDFDENLVDDPGASYGKTMLVNLKSGQARVFTTGHRNQQGLYVDQDNTVWSTEHGPRGGDEINKLVNGGFYGWPRITYGTDYGKLIWPLTAPEDQSKYTLPVFAWVPSIGVSNLSVVENDGVFPLWQGDLLVGSLREQTLYRVRLGKGIVRYVEPIPIGERIRDIRIDGNGILLWTDSRSLIQILPSHD